MYYNKKFLYIATFVLLLSGCTKNFEETNTNPYNPTTTSLPPAVNSVIATLMLQWHEQASVHNDWYYPATQLAGVTAGSGYVLADGINEIWNDYYTSMQNVNAVLDGTASYVDPEAMTNIKAIALILRAYKTSRVTDQFGDIPYFDAGKAYTGDITKYRVKYDKQQDIYLSLLSDLKWANDNIVTDASAVTSKGDKYVGMGSEDTFFGGDLNMWKKFANSLRLRLAVQIEEADANDANAAIQEILGSNLPLVEDGEDVGMWPAKLNNLDIASRPWSFNSHKFIRMSTTFWNMVADGTDTASVFDPRVFVFVEPNQAGDYAAYQIGSTQTDTKNPYKSDRDNDYSDKDGCIYSPFNYHLVRDEFYIPELILTAAEVHFLKAEAYLRGLGVAKDAAKAQTEYKAGITSSVNFWYDIAQNTNTTHDDWAAVAPGSPTTAQWTALFTNTKVAFTGNDAGDLKKIYAQEWLSYFRQPWLAFNLWRRTGATPRDGEPSAYANFYRLTYPQNEAVYNTDNFNSQVNSMGGNDASVKVWWMK
ncbi:MAG TPA: SusD/RagB family nutrient-binding outer membrane lipoprotein [Chitinophagaceae bacterium]|nr:SusD/RagB family nutrient-binding outer membrane lipoprotein [Chitinophagaceae bacterium]